MDYWIGQATKKRRAQEDMVNVYHSLVGSWSLDDVKVGKYTSLFDGGHIIYAVIDSMADSRSSAVVQCIACEHVTFFGPLVWPGKLHEPSVCPSRQV